MDVAPADVIGRRGAIRVGADVHVALLCAQHHPCIHAHRQSACARGGIGEGLPQLGAAVGRCAELVGNLAGEAHAEHTDRNASYLSLAESHVRKCGCRDVEIGFQGGEHVARARPRDCRDGPVGRDRRHDHAMVQELALQPFIEHRGDTGGAGAGRADPEMIVGEACCHAVVDDHALLVQHQAITAVARLQRGHGVGVDEVQEAGGIGAYDFDLAEWRVVKHAEGVSHCQSLALQGGLAVGSVECGPQPFAEFLECRAHGCVPAMDRRASLRAIEKVAPVAGEGAHAHGCERGAVARGAHGPGRACSGGGEERDSVCVAGPALVGRHALRRVALCVLDRHEVLAGGQVEVVDRRVGLEVDKGLLASWKARGLWCFGQAFSAGATDHPDGCHG